LNETSTSPSDPEAGAADMAALPLMDPAQTAFFFDFDGTLAEIVDDPQAVSISEALRSDLAALQHAAGQAVAVVSGREIATLDRFLAPLALPLGGAHGAERRNALGEISRIDVDTALLDRLEASLATMAASHDGLIVERKRSSVALHFRRRPDLAAACEALVRDLAGQADAVSLLAGKMVFELKLSGRTKGDLIAAFMAEKPFAGRRPVYFGDDITDEDAFRVLPRWNGVSVKIGDGKTAARHRLASPAALHAWIADLLAFDRRRTDEQHDLGAHARLQWGGGGADENSSVQNREE
jgi:trehalose 6-phosphate phosphatase